MQKLRLYAQSLNITFESWLASLVCIVLIRVFLEQFSNFVPGNFVLIDTPTLIHYIAFYLASTGAFILILLVFAKIELREALGISILGLFVICIGPLIDLVTGGIGGHTITYFFLPGKELLLRFLTFFGGHFNSGITLGVQIETILGIIFCYLYSYTATKSKKQAMWAAVSFYCVIFFLVSTPSILALFLPQQNGVVPALAHSMNVSNIIPNNIHPNFTANDLGLFDLAFDKIMAGINIILALIISFFLFFIGARKKFLAVIKNSRPERIFHFWLLFAFGLVLSHQVWFSGWIDVQSLILTLIAFTSAWMFSVCQNDIYDENIDLISNQNRPLASKNLSKEDMQIASKIFLLFALIPAYAASQYTLFFTIFFLLVYFIYSNPPLRLKKFVIVNSFLVSLACLSIIMAGFFLLSPDKSIAAFPPGLTLGIVIFFTAVANIRDIKDVEGDRRDGIKTLPVLIGLEKSKKLIAGIICFFFLIIPWYFKVPFLFIPAIITSIFSWHFITAKNYQEWKGFVVYMMYLILIMVVLTLK